MPKDVFEAFKKTDCEQIDHILSSIEQFLQGKGDFSEIFPDEKIGKGDFTEISTAQNKLVNFQKMSFKSQVSSLKGLMNYAQMERANARQIAHHDGTMLPQLTGNDKALIIMGSFIGFMILVGCMVFRSRELE